MLPMHTAYFPDPGRFRESAVRKVRMSRCLRDVQCHDVHPFKVLHSGSLNKR